MAPPRYAPLHQNILALVVAVLFCEDLESTDRSLDNCGSDNEQIRHGTELRQDFKRLVRRAILAYIDRVVCAAGYTDGGHGVLVEDGEASAV